MISRRPDRVGQVEVDRAVEATRAAAARVEVGGAVGRADHEDVRRHAAALVDRAGAPAASRLAKSMNQPRIRVAAGGRVERLQLDQQLVDDAGDALARRAAVDLAVQVEATGNGVDAHAAAGAGDGVDLLDEADRAALFAGGLAQRLEVVADLAAGLAVVHRLERGRRHEQERHAGLARHGLGHVGLAGAGRTLEQDRLARVAAHLLAERLVAEEQVERLDDLVAAPARGRRRRRA